MRKKFHTQLLLACLLWMLWQGLRPDVFLMPQMNPPWPVPATAS